MPPSTPTDAADPVGIRGSGNACGSTSWAADVALEAVSPTTPMPALPPHAGPPRSPLCASPDARRPLHVPEPAQVACELQYVPSFQPRVTPTSRSPRPQTRTTAVNAAQSTTANSLPTRHRFPNARSGLPVPHFTTRTPSSAQRYIHLRSPASLPPPSILHIIPPAPLQSAKFHAVRRPAQRPPPTTRKLRARPQRPPAPPCAASPRRLRSPTRVSVS
ncbi:hypothetical protein B0H15DRAFT_872564 [Mycena belliarum]|uniref:Uncharacterized protein n=1 Tax=Mycena belliarum TaxID=1033014 RepID=A0AAD6XKK4_9AGAR|nr:hypothetical protein B0H15DRAFT_872564 [Mycena belliae]